MFVPTKTLSVPKLEIAFLLIVFSCIVHAIPQKFKNSGDGGKGGERVEDMQIPGVGILKK